MIKKKKGFGGLSPGVLILEIKVTAQEPPRVGIIERKKGS